MALVGNISGSSSASSIIGVTGSVIFSNNPAASFPNSLPGADVQFFVSGSRGGKNGTTRNVAVFGGDAVVSGSLTVGTGSIVITSNDIQIGSAGQVQFGTAANRITLAGSDIKFFDSSNPSGKTLSELASGGGGGESVFTSANSSEAYTTSSIAIGTAATADANGTDVFFFVSGSIDGTKSALFGGNIITSGSLNLKNAAGAEVAYVAGNGVISGSSNLLAGGNLTVAGTSTLVGDVTLSGDITVGGNDIKSSTGATAITLSGANVIIPGDLTVQGTTLTVDATTVEMEDPVIGLGFTSGSTAVSVGDRGFIGGLSGVNNAAFIWDHSESGFAAIRTTSGTATGSPITVTDYTTLRSGKLELGGGTSAYLTSSVGSDLLVYGTGNSTIQSNTGKVVLNGASAQGVEFDIASTAYAEFKNNGTDAQFGAVSGKNLYVSGATVIVNTNAAANFSRNGARVGQLIGFDGTEFKLAAMNSSGGATNLILSGSGVDLSANSTGFNFKFADTGRGSVSYGSNTLVLGSAASIALSLSASNGFVLTHGSNGATFINNFGSPGYLVVEADGPDARLRSAADLVLRADGNDVKFNNSSQTVLTLTTTGNNANFQGANNQTVTIGGVGSSGVMNVSGSTVGVNFGTGGLKFYRDWVEGLFINAVGSTTTISGSASQNVTLAAGLGASTLLTLSGSAIDLNAGVLSGVTFKKDGTPFAVAGQTSDGITGLFPSSDSGASLGSPARRWANVYTGDLHLRNDRGNWTIIEEEDYLSITNNLSGKRYKFVLEEL